MEDPKVTKAREEAASAIKLAHQMTEIVGWLVADLRAAQVLTPQTSTKILQLLTADDHNIYRSAEAKKRLRERLLGRQSRLEQEMKKDEPYRPEGE